MLLGYGRVSTADQNPDHQTDALHRAGVEPTDVYLDHASGAKASRPQLDQALRNLRAGDTLIITRLDRLGRSVLHLVTLGASLRERGIGLKVLEQGIDTGTAEGRAMFGMLSVLATALSNRSCGTLSKNFWTSRSSTQSCFQQRLLVTANASWALRPGR
jgi:DNA invertase Pin-like site-specific DNA recombinase